MAPTTEAELGDELMVALRHIHGGGGGILNALWKKERYSKKGGGLEEREETTHSECKTLILMVDSRYLALKKSEYIQVWFFDHQPHNNQAVYYSFTV